MQYITQKVIQRSFKLPCGLLRFRDSKQQLKSVTGAASVHASRQRSICYASGQDFESGREVYQGTFGPWSVEPADEFEVWTYRLGLTATAAAFLGCAFITSSSMTAEETALALLNPLCFIGAAGLGTSLVQIHIYVDPLKKALQVLWLLGVVGALYVASQRPEQALPLAVAAEPWTIWCVGPAAAAVTGVAIKEGLCYGKPEAALLAVLLPLLCLSHLAGDFVPSQIQGALLAGVCSAAGVFAARKYSQPVKDDIGDKSVFEFRKLPQEQQEQLLQQLKER